MNIWHRKHWSEIKACDGPWLTACGKKSNNASNDLMYPMPDGFKPCKKCR